MTHQHTRITHRFNSIKLPAASCQLVVCKSLDMSFGGMDISMPDIDGDLKSVETELGAKFNAAGVPTTFGTARQALEATSSGAVLLDRSHWPRVLIAGRDRIPLLQKYSSQDFSELKSGQGCDTILLDEDGRAVDFVTVFLAESHIMMLVSPGNSSVVQEWAKKRAREGEMKVMVSDVSSKCGMLTLIGPESEKVLMELMGTLPPALGDGITSYGCHTLLKFRGTPLLVAVGCGVPCLGYTLIVDETVAGDLFSILASKNCVLMGDEEWETLRVQVGRPALGHELLQGLHAPSPLEAGLYHAASVSKVIGFEGMKKLAEEEAQGLKRQLWGLTSKAPVMVGSTLRHQEKDAGQITSSTVTPNNIHLALAYINLEEVPEPEPGMVLEVGNVPATLSTLPFATRQFLGDVLRSEAQQLSALDSSLGRTQPVTGPGAEVMAQLAALERQRMLEEAALQEENRLRHIQDAQERLERWRAKQLGEVL
ncbi:hypothetical protein CEUSTIGMA_g1757.t1 [Chlamydomonas eustigma]|uniref:GCVT N-terminal domain-containing protein n=1 Tax=Chlamydomonas eustigma TaxID=1157962 RepID=A0A250WU06_9CHLO|nr:hypothetical protein CEUSTIGMA_g1757.t1 [Chlamydomonas eustigma]|eukprot:GAX74308.1 hypothetical protein CEUSTIGMA_g1757.t1 [Chlamydomonas eustigma]